MSDAGIDIDAGLSLAIGRLGDSVDDLNKRWAKATAQPVFSRQVSQGVVLSNGFIGFGLSGPNSGWLREIRSITVGGITPTTTATGRADIYISGSNLEGIIDQGASPGLSDWRDYSATIPNVAFYGRGEIVLHNPEKLFVMISGATSGQQIVAACSFFDFQDGAYNSGYGM